MSMLLQYGEMVAGTTGEADEVAYDQNTTVEEKLNQITSDLSELRLKLLWENSSPTSDFAAQTIELSSSDYDLLLFISRTTKSSTYEVSNIVTKSNNFNANIVTPQGGVSCAISRSTSSTDATHLSVGDASIMNTTNSVVTASQNHLMIPYKVYGIKIS